MCVHVCVFSVQLEHALEQMEDQWREKASELTAHYSTLLREAEQRAQVS